MRKPLLNPSGGTVGRVNEHGDELPVLFFNEFSGPGHNPLPGVGALSHLGQLRRKGACTRPTPELRLPHDSPHRPIRRRQIVNPVQFAGLRNLRADLPAVRTHRHGPLRHHGKPHLPWLVILPLLARPQTLSGSRRLSIPLPPGIPVLFFCSRVFLTCQVYSFSPYIRNAPRPFHRSGRGLSQILTIVKKFNSNNFLIFHFYITDVYVILKFIVRLFFGNKQF